MEEENPNHRLSVVRASFFVVQVEDRQCGGTL